MTEALCQRQLSAKQNGDRCSRKSALRNGPIECGTYGVNSTTDNVSYHNLLNIKRLAYLVANP